MNKNRKQNLTKIVTDWPNWRKTPVITHKVKVKVILLLCVTCMDNSLFFTEKHYRLKLCIHSESDCLVLSMEVMIINWRTKHSSFIDKVVQLSIKVLVKPWSFILNIFFAGSDLIDIFFPFVTLIVTLNLKR